MRRVLRLLPLASLLAVIGCPQDAAPPDPTQTVTPVSGNLVVPAPTATSAAAAVTATVAEEPEEPEEPDEPEEIGRKPTCKSAPWWQTEPCASGEFAFAAGAAPGIKNRALARTTAANRARAALVQARGEAAGTLNGSQIVAEGRCKKATVVLIKAPLAEMAEAKLPACGPELP
jgi:hypothetical protein